MTLILKKTNGSIQLVDETAARGYVLSVGENGVIESSGATGGSISKEAVESVLTGEITTHTHTSSGGLTKAQALAIGLL